MTALGMEKVRRFLPHALVVVFSVCLLVLAFEAPDYLGVLNLLTLAATLLALVWYTFETHKIANESVKQTELENMPVMCLYVRYVDGVKDQAERESIKQYAITHLVGQGIIPSNYYIALRSVGKGPAFNVTIDSSEFKAAKYQTQFFGAGREEHAVKVVRKPNNKIRDLNEINGSVFTVGCESALGQKYEYKYKILDINERIVSFLGRGTVE